VELVLHVVVEAEIQVDALIGRAVERADGGGGGAAAGVDAAAVEDELGVLVGLAQLPNGSFTDTEDPPPESSCSARKMMIPITPSPPGMATRPPPGNPLPAPLWSITSVLSTRFQRMNPSCPP
jgi:hypothetical protein